MVSRLQEGNIEANIINRVRNTFQEGLTDSLFHDRIFWLDSANIEHLDYDVRVTNMVNTMQAQQFKAIVAQFAVHGLELAKGDGQKLLKQHY